MMDSDQEVVNKTDGSGEVRSARRREYSALSASTGITEAGSSWIRTSRLPMKNSLSQHLRIVVCQIPNQPHRLLGPVACQ
jgi:hypothetical protein